MKITTLCKLVNDPAEETKGAWKEVACMICDTRLRLTLKADGAIREAGHTPFPICFPCALLGPEVVEDWKDLSV